MQSRFFRQLGPHGSYSDDHDWASEYDCACPGTVVSLIRFQQILLLYAGAVLAGCPACIIAHTVTPVLQKTQVPVCRSVALPSARPEEFQVHEASEVCLGLAQLMRR